MYVVLYGSTCALDIYTWVHLVTCFILLCLRFYLSRESREKLKSSSLIVSSNLVNKADSDTDIMKLFPCHKHLEHSPCWWDFKLMKSEENFPPPLDKNSLAWTEEVGPVGPICLKT